MSSIVESLLTAHARGKRPSAPGVNLRGVNLEGANLQNANLCDADLGGACLQGANLQGADLWHANLQGANLEGANLEGANLWHTSLRWSNLQGANLQGANLQGANLRGLRRYGIVALGETPSGPSYVLPTPAGWTMQVGCWEGSPSGLRDLVAKDEGWPQARGHEVAYRRPYLELVLAHADLVMVEHGGLIEQLAAKWSAA